MTSKEQAKPTPHEIVNSMLAPGSNSIFVLGCFERGITFYHQQVRALNLVYALHKLGYLNKEQKRYLNKDKEKKNEKVKIAVVGAGVAGLTAAAAFSNSPNCKVTLLEKKDKLLPVIDQGGERYLSPFLYEWPGVKAADETHARLDSDPLTSWKPGNQETVIQYFDNEWRRKFKYKDNISVICNADPVQLISKKSDKQLKLSWYVVDDSLTSSEDDKCREKDEFDFIVLALGFGYERTIDPIEPHSYWMKDDLENETDSDKRFLVSGAGDGGWTDLFRLAIPEFKQETLKEDYLSESLISRDVVKSIMYLEELAKSDQALGRDPAPNLTKAYKNLPTDELKEKLKKLCNSKVPQPEIFFNANENYVSLNSFPANRLIGMCLIKADIVKHWPGRIIRIIKNKSDSNKRKYTVILDGGKTKDFDRVIIRHGTVQALAQFDQDLFNECAPALRQVARIDRTKLRAWPDNYFQEEITKDAERPTSAGYQSGFDIDDYASKISNYFKEKFTTEVLDAASKSKLNEQLPTSLIDSEESDYLESKIENCPISVKYYPRNKVAVEYWYGSIAAYAYLNPDKLGLTKKYLPLPLPGKILSEQLRQNSGSNLQQTIVKIIKQVYDIELKWEDLVQWPNQIGSQWLVPVDCSPTRNNDQDWNELFGKLQDFLTVENGFNVIMLLAAS